MIDCPICNKEMYYYAVFKNNVASDISGKCGTCKIDVFFKEACSSDKIYVFNNKSYEEEEIIRVFKQRAFL